MWLFMPDNATASTTHSSVPAIKEVFGERRWRRPRSPDLYSWIFSM